MNNNVFSNKIVLVTGAGRGIGAATAELFALHGAQLVLVSKTESELRKVESQIKAQTPNAITLISARDLSQENEVLSLFQEIEQKFGTLDILINNAGLFQSAMIEDQFAFFYAKISILYTYILFCTQYKGTFGV